MALVDPNIAMSYRGIEVPNQLAQYAQVQQIQNAQRQNKLAEAQMAEYERGRAQKEGLRNFLTGADLTSPASRQELLGYGESGREVYESILKGEKDAREGKKAAADIAAARIKQARDFLPSVNSPDMYAKWRNYTLQNLPDLADVIPEQYSPDTVRGLMLEADKALEQHFVSQNLGPTTRVIATPKYGGGPARVVEGSEGRVGMTLAEAARIKLDQDKFAADEAARVPKEDPRVVVANTLTDAAGNVTQYNKFGEQIGTVKQGVGKPSATFEKTTAQRKQMAVDLDRAIAELTAATAKNGLIDQSTGSGAGRLRDIGAGFFGQATSGAIAGGKIAPIADLVLKMVPRFEGPQSNADTTSYKEAAGQLADTTLPNEIRRQAGLEILRLMKERKGQFVSAEMAAEGAGAAQPSLESIFGPK